MSEYFNLLDFNYNSLSESKIKQLAGLMKKNYVSAWNQTLQHSRKLSFHHLQPFSSPWFSTKKKNMRRTLVKLRIDFHLLKQVVTTKSLSMNGCVVITFRTKRITNKIVRDIPRRETFLSKIETKLMIFENYRMKIWYHNWLILMITILTFD